MSNLFNEIIGIAGNTTTISNNNENVSSNRNTNTSTNGTSFKERAKKYRASEGSSDTLKDDMEFFMGKESAIYECVVGCKKGMLIEPISLDEYNIATGKNIEKEVAVKQKAVFFKIVKDENGNEVEEYKLLKLNQFKEIFKFVETNSYAVCERCGQKATKENIKFFNSVKENKKISDYVKNQMNNYEHLCFNCQTFKPYENAKRFRHVKDLINDYKAEAYYIEEINNKDKECCSKCKNVLNDNEIILNDMKKDITNGKKLCFTHMRELEKSLKKSNK